MKEPYESSLFDHELKKLDADFVWTGANSPELKVKLIRDINKKHLRSQFTNQLGSLLRFSAFAAVLLIVFIIGNHQLTLNHDSGSGISTDDEREYPFANTPVNGDRTITYTASEQNLIEDVVSQDLGKEVSFISGKPKIEVTRNNELLTIKATYPVTNGQPIIVRAIENTFSSIQDVKQTLKSMYPQSKKISIADSEAILYNSGNGGSSELLLIKNKFLYLIKGDKNESSLIKVAEEIHFSN